MCAGFTHPTINGLPILGTADPGDVNDPDFYFLFFSVQPNEDSGPWLVEIIKYDQ